jgi:membrane protein YdbS with pleckstrin-like domain
MTGPDPLRPWPETVQWRRISPRQIVLEEFRLAVSVGVGVAICFAVATAIDSAIPKWVAAGLGLIGLVRAIMIIRAVRAWGYAEREHDLLVRHGLMVRRLSIVPYARMQFVDVSAGPLERILRLATVQMHTAAAASNARVPGLAPAEAARLRDRLAALGEIRAEGL